MPDEHVPFEEFVDAETPRLLGLARALTGNGHDAWDLVQETLVGVGVRWSRIDASGAPAAYARTTLVRLNIDRLRRLRREWVGGALPDRGVDAPLPNGVDEWLVHALRGLTPRQRTAVVLRFVEDLDLAGIAARMDCSVGTVKSHLSRGLERLRAHAPERVRSEGETDGQR